MAGRSGNRSGAKGDRWVISAMARTGKVGLLRRAVDVEQPDRGTLADVREEGGNDLARELLTQLRLLLLEGRDGLAPVHDLDHVPAELRLDRLVTDRAGRDRERGLGELGHHRLAPEIAEVAA